MATFLHLAEEERFDELKQALDLGLFTENINVTNKYYQTIFARDQQTHQQVFVKHGLLCQLQS
jgi:hypothetical protein